MALFHHKVLMRLRRSQRDRVRTIERRHRSRRVASSAPSDPLATGIGTHYTYLWVGTPPQRISVIVDTGSYRTAFPCDPCDSCGDYLDYHESGPFQSSESSSFAASNVRVTQSYSEGDGWSGIKIHDESFLGAATLEESPSASDYSINSELYCQDTIDGLFITQYADGIMGLGLKDSSPIVQLVNTGLLERNAFSLCLASEGGTFSVGETASHLWTSPKVMQYAKMTPKQGVFYGVTVRDILIPPKDGSSDGSIEAKSYGGTGSFIVDSGTTYTYLPESIKPNFVAQWEAVSGKIFDVDKPLGEWGKVGWLPDIEFALQAHSQSDETVKYIVKPDAYVDRYCPATTCYAYLSIMFDDQQAILGANFMQDHDVLFDADTKEIGFATAKCEWVGPYDDPSSFPTLTPAPTVTNAPTPHPKKSSSHQNEEAANVAIAVIVLAVACFLGVTFAASRNGMRRFRRTQEQEKSSRGTGVFVPQSRSCYHSTCRCLVACIDRCDSSTRPKFAALQDEDALAIEIPELYAFPIETREGQQQTREVGSDKHYLSSLASTSIANRILSKKKGPGGYERPGEGSEF